MAYISKWSETLERQGWIDGLLLSGLTANGVDLMERFIDRTGDCQTAALIMSTLSCYQDARTDIWIQWYIY